MRLAKLLAGQSLRIQAQRAAAEDIALSVWGV